MRIRLTRPLRGLLKGHGGELLPRETTETDTRVCVWLNGEAYQRVIPAHYVEYAYEEIRFTEAN